MVVKINNKPIRVSKENETSWYENVDWLYTATTIIGTTIIFYVLDEIVYLLVGTHPFPFIDFLGGVIEWVGSLNIR